MSQRVVDAFRDPTYPPRPYTRGADGRWRRPEDWYEYLQVTPEEIAEQCRAKGFNDEDVQEIIRTWGTRLYRGPRRARPAAPGETLEDPRAEAIPNLPAIHRYDVEVEKPAAAEIFTGCRLNENATPETIRAFDKFKCQEILCNDDVADLDGRLRRRKVRNPGQLSEVIADNPSNRGIYEHCRRVNETHCKSHSSVGLTIDPATVTHVPNPGIGDCLFIAVAHYEYMARQLGEYITPGSPEALAVPEGSITSATYLTTGEYKKDSKVVDTRQKALRAEVVAWYVANADAPYPSSVIFGMSVRDELARICADAETAGTQFGFKSGLSACNRDHADAMALLRAAHGPIDGYSAMTIIQERGGRDERYLVARAKFVDCLFKAYVAQISKQTTYAGQAEIEALAQILDKNIYILQKNIDNTLTSNLGVIEEGRSNIYILHKASVQGGGAMHYEVLFPVTPDKFRKPEGYALSKVLTSIGGPARTIINFSRYYKEIARYLESMKKDQINEAGMALAMNIKEFSVEERRIVLDWFKETFQPYLADHEELHGTWSDILQSVNDKSLMALLVEEEEASASAALADNPVVKKILAAADKTVFTHKPRIYEYIVDFLRKYNQLTSLAKNRVSVLSPVFGSPTYEAECAKNMESAKTAAVNLTNVRLEDKIRLREGLRYILLKWITQNEKILSDYNIKITPTEEGLNLPELLTVLEKIMEEFDI